MTKDEIEQRVADILEREPPPPKIDAADATSEQWSVLDNDYVASICWGPRHSGKSTAGRLKVAKTLMECDGSRVAYAAFLDEGGLRDELCELLDRKNAMWCMGSCEPVDSVLVGDSIAWMGGWRDVRAIIGAQSVSLIVVDDCDLLSNFDLEQVIKTALPVVIANDGQLLLIGETPDPTDEKQAVWRGLFERGKWFKCRMNLLQNRYLEHGEDSTRLDIDASEKVRKIWEASRK